MGSASGILVRRGSELQLALIIVFSIFWLVEIILSQTSVVGSPNGYAWRIYVIPIFFLNMAIRIHHKNFKVILASSVLHGFFLVFSVWLLYWWKFEFHNLLILESTAFVFLCSLAIVGAVQFPCLLCLAFTLKNEHRGKEDTKEDHKNSSDLVI